MTHAAALMQRLSEAYNADVPISPMIVVGSLDSKDVATKWLGCITRIEQACWMAGTHPLSYWVGRDDRSQLRSHAMDHGFMPGLSTRTAILNVQGSADESLLTDMLTMLYDDAVCDYVVAIVVRPDQLEGVLKCIRQGLGIPAPLVPVWWQDAGMAPMQMPIVGHATLAGRSNGRYLIRADVARPYPHQVEIDVDMGDVDEGRAMELLQDMVRDRRFAVATTVGEDRIQATFGDIVVL